MEVPELTEDNHIDFKKHVHPNIVERAERKLGISIPQKALLDGKDFRKFLARNFEKQICIDLAEGQSMTKALELAGEREASGFLTSIDVGFIT